MRSPTPLRTGLARSSRKWSCACSAAKPASSTGLRASSSALSSPAPLRGPAGGVSRRPASSAWAATPSPARSRSWGSTNRSRPPKPTRRFLAWRLGGFSRRLRDAGVACAPIELETRVHKRHDLVDCGMAHAFAGGDALDQAVHPLDVRCAAEKSARRGRRVREPLGGSGVLLERHEVLFVRAERY